MINIFSWKLLTWEKIPHIIIMSWDLFPPLTSEENTMNTIKKLSAFSTALLMTAAMGSAYADETDMSQIRTQDRVRTETNLQTPASDSGQSRFQKQKQNQFRHEYKYRNKSETQGGGAGTSSMNRQSMSRSANGGGRR